MIQKTWLPSRCLAMDDRSDSDISAFSGTPQIVIMTCVYVCLYGSVVYVTVTVYLYMSVCTYVYVYWPIYNVCLRECMFVCCYV
jgi:hypothetical protein